MRKLIFIFMALILAACSMGSQTEIERNKEKWEAANVSHYRYNLFAGCFCVFSQDMPLVIEVKDGDVVSMDYRNGNEIDASSRELFEKYATVDRIFSELETNIIGKADEVIVTYDPTHGFPTQVDIDFIKDAIDDELSLTISEFERLP